MMDEAHLNRQAEQLSCAVGRLIRALNSLHAEEVETALTIPQARVCGLLREGPQAMTVVSRELGISLSAVTQIADRLERAGLVGRNFSADDGRVRLLHLTEAGEQRVARRHARRLERARVILEQVATEQREGLLTALQTLAQAAQQLMPDPPTDFDDELPPADAQPD